MIRLNRPASISSALLFASLLIASGTTHAQRGPVTISSEDLGGGLFLLRGGSNAVLGVGTDEAVLVDALFGMPEALVTKVGELTTRPVRYVINTHAHPDHTGANAAFAAKGATVVATAATASWMARPFVTPMGTSTPPIAESARPRETFSGSRTISVAGLTAQVTEVPRSHSEGDAFVYFPGANVLVMGDLHHSNEYPVYDVTMGCLCGSFDGNLRAYDMMLAVANATTRIIPGHGGVTNKAEVTAYVAMLRRIRDEVRTLIAAGRTEDEVVALKLLANDKSPTSPGPDNRDQFIRTLYGALKTGKGA